MSKDKQATFCISLNNPIGTDLDNLSIGMAKLQDGTVKYLENEAAKLGISYEAMSDVFYLRSRSRWTQRKEDYLIALDKAGKPLPFIMEDFEVPADFVSEKADYLKAKGFTSE